MATKSAKTRRSPGRPPKARVDQRARLLDVAVDLFARHGIAATPLSAIARRARVTPALLHYYFGDRERLLDALMEERIVPLVAPLQDDLRKLADAPRAQIEAFVHDLLRMLAGHPWLPPLWLREVIGEGGLLRDRLMHRVARPVAATVRDGIARAQARGAINRDLDPRLLMVSLIGLTMFPLAARPIWSRLFDAEDIGPAEFARHTLALLERGLEMHDDRDD